MQKSLSTLLLCLASCLGAGATAGEPVEVTMADRPLPAVQAWAALGDRQAQGELCRRYKTGQGAPRSAADALLHCGRGAAMGLRSAQVWLGDLYLAGEGVARDEALAHQWYMTAAEAGQAQAKFSLYRIYEQGLGRPADRHTAARYLREAAEGGDLQAIEALKKIEPGWRPRAAPVSAPEEVRYLKAQDVLRFTGAPGMFTSAFYRLAAAPRGQVALTVRELKTDPQWAAMASVCVVAEAPSDFACFKLFRTAPDSGVLGASVSTLAADQKIEHDRADLPGQFAVDQTVLVGVDAEAGSTLLRVSVDGRLSSVHRIDFRPELMRLACSTAVCEFKFE
jgi:TPR repeat protein